jgi:RNA polymerase sigma factor (sigma-70 family)
MSAVSGDETEQGLVAPGTRPPLAVPRRLLRMRSDAALAERFAAGDEAAFDVIYERHRPVVLAVCMGVLGTAPDAEDATQETFSALAVTLRTRPPAELRPWLIRVARNASIDTTRRRRHRLLTLDGEIPEIAARPAGSGQAELAVVLDGIRELPEGQRMALLMRELGGHSYSEIAEFLASDEEAVKGLIARARVGLRAYREATELSCAAARNTISAEPDGRRYDKTVRRHLRGCSMCRGYREALRDDAKALRAALPIQAGTVATGSLSGGMLSAAKGSLISYGLTQAATTCAASACAVGAIGGMVFVAPVHQLGLPPILPRISPQATHRHAAVAKAPKHSAAATSHTAVSVSHSSESTSYVPATAEKPAVTHAAVGAHHSRHVTMVSLPTLPKHHSHGGGAPAQAAADNQGNGAPGAANGNQVQGSSTVAVAGTGNASQGQDNQGQGNQGNGHGHGHGNGKTPAQNSTAPTSQVSAASSYQSAANTPVQNAQSSPANPTTQDSRGNGNGHGHGRWGGNGHDANPTYSTASAGPATSGQAAGSPVSTTTTAATSAPPTTTTTVTTASNSTSPWGGQGHGHGRGNGSQAGANQAGATQTSTSTQTGVAPTVSVGGNGHGHGQGHSR